MFYVVGLKFKDRYILIRMEDVYYKYGLKFKDRSSLISLYPNGIYI